MTPQGQPYICDLAPYQPGLPIEEVARTHGLDPAKIIKLASNENPLGMSPKAQAALEQALPRLNRYPEQYMLIQALATNYGVQPEQIVLGNGSNDVLDLIARSYLKSGDEAVSSAYAFAIYQIATQSTGARNVVAPARGYGHDLQAMLQAITPATKVIWIANPNNPTGTFVPYAQIKKFLEDVPPQIVVVLDEAYYEYLPPALQEDTSRWLAEHPNFIVVRTFSKVYGLAGLRIGYALASSQIAELLNRVRQPFNASTAATIAATAALGDRAFVRKSYAANQAGRKKLQSGLNALNLPTLPAYGNFITFAVPDAAALYEALLKKGVIIRPLAAYNMPNFLRVTIGTAEENSRFLVALRQSLV